MQKLVSPEEICLQEASLVGLQQWLDMNYTVKDLDREPKHQPAKFYYDTRPWKLSENFLNAKAVKVYMPYKLQILI